MMTTTLGLDNLAVAFALGPLQFGNRRVAWLGICFGVAEIGMTLLGAALGPAFLPGVVAAEVTRAGALATLAVAMLGFVWIRHRPAAFVGQPAALLGLALLLGIDNLVAASAADAADFVAASLLADGVLIGLLAAAFCAAGGILFRPAPRWGAAASALLLTGLAVAGIT